MSDIVERLRDFQTRDHERGCLGREYVCSCGYDNEIEQATKEAAAEIERLRAEHDRLRNKVHARALTDKQLAEEIVAVDAICDGGFGERGGSPGEWWHERSDELENERKRRELERQVNDHAASEIRSLRREERDEAWNAAWQPIETAPVSNGSNRFLAYVPGHGACVCYAGVARFIYNMKGKRIYKATHWMPLPAEPSLAPAGRAALEEER